MTDGRSAAAPPLRLRLDGDALVANWRWLDKASGAARCGAAVKANGYGLGAVGVVARLVRAGCRDFYVATWAEAAALGPLSEGVALSVLHGVRAEDMAVASTSAARPVINTLAQLERWRSTGLPCDAMVDTGMNRLGLSVADVRAGALDGVDVHTLMSHLACADEDRPENEAQRRAFAALAGTTSARMMSLANSAGVCLGERFAFDMTRPGLALYGGIPRGEADGNITQVAFPQAQVLQVRKIGAGEAVGYGGTWIASRASRIAILNIGYADGYRRALSNAGTCGGGAFAIAGRVSMDLIAADVTGTSIAEGEWLDVDYDLPSMATTVGTSQYELLTGLAERLERRWV